VAVVVLAISCAAQTPQSPPAAPAGKYVGPGSCSASACHGSIRPIANNRILQNEYSTWILQDKHAQAYKALQTPVSKRMGRILDIGDPTTAPKCLACHALSVPLEKKGRDIDLSEGVSCESCHGPASGWLGPHTLKGWKTPQSVALGMIDTANLVRRTDQCTTCHVGTAEKSVDHEMIAAGHPDLVFELDSYSAVMPAHWKKPEDPNAGVRAWSVGQAVQLREALNRLSRRAQSGPWPEYAEYDCFSCHHDLTKADRSWRQERGYPDRRPGNAPWNPAHDALLRLVVKTVDPQLSASFGRDLQAVYEVATRLSANRNDVAAAAKRAVGTTDQVVQRLQTLESSQASSLIHGIIANADELSLQGTRTAEQTAMALESLFAAQNRLTQPQVRTAIDELFKLLENPSAYNGPQFAAKLKQLPQ
jgi:hypothetical protein